MDIFSIFNIFITPEAGLIIAAVMSLMEFVIKPFIKKYFNGNRNKKITKKTILPIIVISLCIIGSFITCPSCIADTGTRILYGLGLGLVSNFVYRAGLSYLSKKLGIESKITNSISPPPGDITL